MLVVRCVRPSRGPDTAMRLAPGAAALPSPVGRQVVARAASLSPGPAAGSAMGPRSYTPPALYRRDLSPAPGAGAGVATAVAAAASAAYAARSGSPSRGVMRVQSQPVLSQASLEVPAAGLRPRPKPGQLRRARPFVPKLKLPGADDPAAAAREAEAQRSVQQQQEMPRDLSDTVSTLATTCSLAAEHPANPMSTATAYAPDIGPSEGVPTAHAEAVGSFGNLRADSTALWEQVRDHRVRLEELSQRLISMGGAARTDHASLNQYSSAIQSVLGSGHAARERPRSFTPAATSPSPQRRRVEGGAPQLQVLVEQSWPRPHSPQQQRQWHWQQPHRQQAGRKPQQGNAYLQQVVARAPPQPREASPAFGAQAHSVCREGGPRRCGSGNNLHIMQVPTAAEGDVPQKVIRQPSAEDEWRKLVGSGLFGLGPRPMAGPPATGGG